MSTGKEIAVAVGVTAPAIAGVVGMHLANKRAKEAERKQLINEKILANLEASRQEIINPYENLAVATQSKQGVSASIEKQEVQNQALKAQGEQLAFQAREAREMQRLDRQAGLIERDMAQAMQYRADAMSTLMGGLNASSQLAMMAYGKKE